MILTENAGASRRLATIGTGSWAYQEGAIALYSDERGNRIVQLHFFKADLPQVERHIAFRDYLRTHPEAASAYEKEKRRAQGLHPDDSHAYTDAKAAWIRDTEAKALIWLAAQQAAPDLRQDSI